MKRILFAAAAAVAISSSPAFARNDNTFLWVHPKLGPQRVDRTTNVPPRLAPASFQGAKAEAPRYRVDYKGNVRRVPSKPSSN